MKNLQELAFLHSKAEVLPPSQEQVQASLQVLGMGDQPVNNREEF